MGGMEVNGLGLGLNLIKFGDLLMSFAKKQSCHV